VPGAERITRGANAGECNPKSKSTQGSKADPIADPTTKAKAARTAEVPARFKSDLKAVEFPECTALSQEKVQHLAANAASARDYFAKLRQYTNLTAGSDFSFYHGHKQAGALSDTSQFSKLDNSTFKRDLPGAIFFGDSITRELAIRYRAIMSNHDKLHPWELAWSPEPDLSVRNGDVQKVLQCKYPMFFVGGNSIWAFDKLIRNNDYKHWDKTMRENHHIKKVSAVIRQMKCLTSATAARGVYISTEPIEQGNYRDPWHKQPAYQELWNWAVLEESMCKKEAVPVLSPHIVAKHCPGVRCDGVHFGSAFADKGCTRSAFLFDRVVASFMDNMNMIPDKYGDHSCGEKAEARYLACCAKAGVRCK
jgi:hypothetical protein